MAKKPRPSFSATPPAARPSTGWVYRTEPGATTPARQRRAGRATASRASKVARSDRDTTRTVSPKKERALGIVARYATAGAAAGLVPIPWLDMAAIGGVQMAMIGALAQEYGQSFEEESFAALLSSVGGASATRWAGYGWGRSLLKLIPGIGTWIALVSMPAFASATTYAIGRAFVRHFESGGTLDDLSSDDARARLRADVESART